MKLFGSLASPFARKVRIVAAEKRIDYTFERADPWQSEQALTGHNPLGKVPVLVLEDGTALYDSRVIVEFLDAVSPIGRLIPADHRERIEVRRWEALADGILDAGGAARKERQRPSHEQNSAWIERQLGKVTRGVAVMNRDLEGSAWCAGTGYSLADIAVGCCVGWLTFRFPDLDWRADSPALARHYDKLMDRSTFVDTMPRE
jgi:glutathione S-transferase